MRLRLAGGRVVDPVTGEDAVRDVFLDGGRIVAPAGGDWETVDCEGAVVAPAFVDLHAGIVDARDLDAAVAGGFGTVALSAEHPVVLERPGEVRSRLAALSADGRCRVLATGALTRGLQGEELGEMGRLLEAGCVALSQGRVGLADARVTRHALEYAGRFGATVFLRPVEVALEGDGVVREGPRALWLGLPGVPPEAEEIAVYRIAALARLAGCRVHLTHLWTRRGVEAVRRVRRAGEPVSASTTAQHLLLDDRVVERTAYAAEARFLPPLGDDGDRAALVEALRDGTLDGVSSDHVPIGRHLRERELQLSPPGSVGLATAFSLTLEAVDDLGLAVRALSSGPRRVLGMGEAGIRPGDPADLVLLAPDDRWRVDAATPLGSHRNQVVEGRELRGRVLQTWVAGRPCRVGGT